MSEDGNEPPNPERTLYRRGRAEASQRGGPAAGWRGQDDSKGAARHGEDWPRAGDGKADLAFAADEPHICGPAPLVAAASRLIRLGGELRKLPVGPDLTRLRELANLERTGFIARAERLGIRSKTIDRADFILCAFIDDAVMSTPWGNGSGWTSDTMLAEHYGNAFGSAALFETAKNLAADPQAEPQILELLYLCLSLGFEGEMALDAHGPVALQRHRDRLHDAIRRVYPAPATELSPQWRGHPTAGSVRLPPVPLWAVFAGAALLALLIFALLLYRLSAQGDGAVHALSEVVGAVPVAAPAQVHVVNESRLRSILEPDIQQGRITVQIGAGDVVIRLIDQTAFASGSATLTSDYSVTFAHIAEAAQIAGGTLTIVGYTDSQPISPLSAISSGYHSNQELSLGRATTVKQALERAGIPASRMRADGGGESNPLGDNATPQGRQMNRRVEIRTANDQAWK